MTFLWNGWSINFLNGPHMNVGLLWRGPPPIHTDAAAGWIRTALGPDVDEPAGNEALEMKFLSRIYILDLVMDYAFHGSQ